MDNVTVKTEARWRHGIQRGEDTEWSPWTKNTICQGLGDLLGILLAYNQPGGSLATGGTIPTGYLSPLYIAIGQGAIDGTWDFPHSTPAVVPTKTQLVSEIASGGRLVANLVGFRQAAPPTGTIAPYTLATVFNRPIFQASWATTFYAPLGLREVGLFGGTRAGTLSNATNGGLLLNALNYPAQLKTSADPNPYTLVWQVEFNIIWS